MRRTARHCTLRDAFRFFGAVAANPVWAWSAISPDGKTVVLTWWKDEVTHHGGKLIHDNYNHPRLKEFCWRLGNRDRIKKLVWAREHCGGSYRVVWCKARDPKAKTRKIIECYPDHTLRMRLTKLNETTGEFRAVSVEQPGPSKPKTVKGRNAGSILDEHERLPRGRPGQFAVYAVRKHDERYVCYVVNSRDAADKKFRELQNRPDVKRVPLRRGRNKGRLSPIVSMEKWDEETAKWLTIKDTEGTRQQLSDEESSDD